jgi:hypothetical protein
MSVVALANFPWLSVRSSLQACVSINIIGSVMSDVFLCTQNLQVVCNSLQVFISRVSLSCCSTILMQLFVCLRCNVSCAPILWLCVVCCSHASRRPGCFAVLCRSRCGNHSSSCSLQHWPCAELRPGAILISCTVGSQHNLSIVFDSLIRESLKSRIMHSSFMRRCVMYRLCVHYASP